MQVPVRRGRLFSAALSIILLAPCMYGADSAPQVHIRHFARVNDHLFRGGQPTEDAIKELVDLHIGTVIDLREPSSATENERHEVEQRGIKYLNVPLAPLSAPNPDQIKRVLSLIEPDDAAPTFVHCWRGKDRTGVVIACYRVQHDGWTPQRALEEAHKEGMSRIEIGMRSFILEFRPIDLPAPMQVER